MSSRRIMPTSAPVGCLWRSTDFTMGSWEMFVIPQKLFFFTGTRLLGVNTPVPDLPSIFTAPAPVRYFFLPSFPLHASHMTALSGDRDIRGPHGISRSNRVRSPGLGSITRRSNRNTVSQTVSDWTLVSLWRLISTSLLHPYQTTKCHGGFNIPGVIHLTGN